MNEADIMIVAHEAKTAADGASTLADKIHAAFKGASNHWMVLDKDRQFRGGIAGILMSLGEAHPDYKRVLHEVEQMKKLNAILVAAQAGLSINMDSLDAGEEEQYEPAGLMKIWKEYNHDRT